MTNVSRRHGLNYRESLSGVLLLVADQLVYLDCCLDCDAEAREPDGVYRYKTRGTIRTLIPV